MEKPVETERVLVEYPYRIVWFIEEDGALSSAHMNTEEINKEYNLL